MKILDFLCSDAVSADLKATNKKEIIEEMVTMMVEAGAFEKKHKAKIIETLMAREALGSTAIGQGIAIPHGKTDCVDKLVAGLAISKKGIDFDALDGEPAYIFFLLAAPVDSAGPHLKALARVSRLLKDKYFRESLRSAKDRKDILELVSREDAQIN
ncbi:MAG: PTS sugar transporter subunit IIA [Candidatus Omnitrophica bacterium]|nr:PTS sugar transporter subunit IIA [Candidatus Omnitrophota bacterium]